MPKHHELLVDKTIVASCLTVEEVSFEVCFENQGLVRMLYLQVKVLTSFFMDGDPPLLPVIFGREDILLHPLSFLHASCHLLLRRGNGGRFHTVAATGGKQQGEKENRGELQFQDVHGRLQ